MYVGPIVAFGCLNGRFSRIYGLSHVIFVDGGGDSLILEPQDANQGSEYALKPSFLLVLILSGRAIRSKAATRSC